MKNLSMRFSLWRVKMKNRIGIILLVSCTALGLLACKAKDKTIMVRTEIPDSTSSYSFPDDWVGHWYGDLEIYNAAGLQQTIAMGLEILDTDSSGVYDWTIIYGQDSSAQRRAYQLLPVDTSQGHYVIDEKNGILIDAYHVRDALTSVFEVSGNMLVISYQRTREDMIFSVKLFPTEEVRISGDTLIAAQEIPEVKSFHLKVDQVGRLQKKRLVE